MRYFYHKLGNGNSLVEKYLLRRGEIVVFFGDSTVASCRLERITHDAYKFVTCADPEHRDSTRIVIVSGLRFRVLKPTGPARDGERVPADDETGRLHREKLMPVETLVDLCVSEIPHLLASMSSNAYWSRGSFREIGQQRPSTKERWPGWQHQFSIDLLLRAASRGSPCPPPISWERLLFLSSVELETLVARLLEEAGCFVPAYRGGTLPDVDILAHNQGQTDIVIGNLRLAAHGKLLVQVKSWSTDRPAISKGVWLVSPNLPAKWAIPGWDGPMLWALLAHYPKTKAWLEKSLAWLPDA